jgi:Ca-activated chloride channel family protein
MMRGESIIERVTRLERALVVLLLAPLLCAFDPFTTTNDQVEQGNGRLASGKLKEALKHYDKAAEQLPREAGVHYNRGVALYSLGRYADAREALLKATATQDRTLKGRSFYNLGNALYKLKKYKDAALAYQRALRQQPSHQAAKWNLELALRQIEKKKKEKKKNKKDKKNKKKQDDKQQKKNQDKKKPQPKKQDDKKKKKSDKQDKKQGQDKKKSGDDERDKKRDKPKQKKQPKKQQSKKQRDEQRRRKQVLDALDRNDKNLQRRRARRRRGRGAYRKPSKDW